ncbi:hypothetical protein C0585_01305 [Candidatus Woesearchaeota archaeon]|nr:MAG: hypothetical protein C0585_01305 [Candidatus Woesearchaeota archaeon]
MFYNSDLDISNLSIEEIDYYKIKKTEPSLLQSLISSKTDFMDDEPYSVGIHSAFMNLLFNFFGFRIYFALNMALTSALIFLTLIRFTKSIFFGMMSIILINIGILNSFSNSININFLAMLVSTSILYSIYSLKENRIKYAIIGVSYSILGSIRPVTLIFAPAFLYYFYKEKNKDIFLTFLISSIITILPVFILNKLIFGNPLQFPGFLYYPFFEHSFLGYVFNTRTLFNYPFIDEIIRTPGFILPMFLYMPLVIIKEFGIILFSFIFFAFINKKRTKIKKFLLLASISLVFLMMISENWRDPKTTILLIIVPFLIMLTLEGVNNFIQIKNKKKIIYISIIILILYISFLSIKDLEFKKDMRTEIIDKTRIVENKEYLEMEKKRLFNNLLFPGLQFNNLNIKNLQEEMGDRKEYPILLNDYIPCVEDSAIISPNLIYEDEKNIYFIPSHIMGLEFYLEEISEIELNNISKGKIFKNISSRDSCFIFDLEMVKIDEETIMNISNKRYNGFPDQIISKKVKLDLPDDIKRIKIYEENNILVHDHIIQNG